MLTYDGNSNLEKQKATVSGTCPLVLGHARREVNCVYTNWIAWSTALGDPTLAYTKYGNSSSNYGYTDYIMGPDEAPAEQVDYDGSGSFLDANYYYQDLSGNTRALIDTTGSLSATYNYPAWGGHDGLGQWAYERYAATNCRPVYR